MIDDEQIKTRPIIGEGDETTGKWHLRYCTELSLATLELAILCACWYARQKTISEANSFIPPTVFQFQEDILIPGARKRERVEIKDPLPLLEAPIQILTRDDFLTNPTKHQHLSIEAEKAYLKECCEKSARAALPQLYRIPEAQRFQLFASLIWAMYAGKIESAEIQEAHADPIPEEVINAQEIFRSNFNLPHQRFIAARQVNNEARRILTTIKAETGNLLPGKEKERWLTKSEHQINDDIFRTRQAVLKSYITQEDADQLRELEEAERRVEESARKKKLQQDDPDEDELPSAKWDQ